jgi:predicted transcriptional regulator
MASVAFARDSRGASFLTGENSEDVHTVAKVVQAYVANNRMMAQDIPSLISSVHQMISGLRNGGSGGPQEAQKPAISIKKSVTDAYIICLEDGLKFKSLKRHLRTSYGLTPEQYRSKWGLPHDYPMVAPNYAAHRSRLAKSIGLGRKRVAGRRR